MDDAKSLNLLDNRRRNRQRQIQLDIRERSVEGRFCVPIIVRRK